MKNRNEPESDVMVHTHHVFRAHQPLLDDAVRNRAFFSALRKRLGSDSALLDVGSGTGVWAIAAAKIGAKRVVAIEKDELLAGLIRTLARENQVQDRVEVIVGDSREVSLKGRFDVIVSETIGNLAFDEQIVPILIDARKRFLKRNGALIPGSIALMAAAAHLKGRSKQAPAGIPITCGYFDSLNRNIPVMLEDKSRLTILSDRIEITRVDLTRIKTPPKPENLTANWKLNDATGVNCFAVWAEATLTDGVDLSTLDTTSWSPIIYRITPFEQQRGTIRFSLNLSERNNYWSASISNKESEETQGYSPVFAYAALNANRGA
ncbi:MAG TPA: 50S ribosomal protein L11 methyltransferase [Blastocatellia bacterium]|nr:50S ribosomal protein L11 methyltransferase [Blastocatellia bacterium]